MIQQRRSARHQDRYVEAIRLFGEAIEIDPKCRKAWVSKGLTLKALGRDAEADVAFAEALHKISAKMEPTLTD